jgi:hypothetical protein
MGAVGQRPLHDKHIIARTDLTFVPIRAYSYRDVLAAGRVPVSAFWRYRVSFQRKKCRQQIIGLNDESFSIAVWTSAGKVATFESAGVGVGVGVSVGAGVGVSGGDGVGVSGVGVEVGPA